MITYVLISFASLLAILLPIAGVFAILFLSNANKTRPVGFLHYLPYLLLLVIAADTFFSGRVMNQEMELLHKAVSRGQVSAWLIRLCTLFAIAGSFERIANFVHEHKHPLGNTPLLSVFFILFWLCSVGLGAIVSANPSFSHEYLYPLIIGMGILCFNEKEIHLFLISLRNALLVFIGVSFLLILVTPQLVIQTNYAIGFIPGLPRMAGLAAHAIVFGVLSLILLALVIKFPYKSPRVQKFVIVIALIGLFMAQSKTVWVTTLQVLAVMGYFAMRDRVQGEPLLRSQIILSILATLFFAACMIVVVATLGGLVGKVANFLDSKDGAQLLTLTGRDIIWDFALSEWRNHPIFGYGPGFLNYEHRTMVGLVSATHAHNEFVDLLARSGIVGLLSVIPYLLLTVYLISQLKRPEKELAVIAFVIVINRCVSEVPLSLFGYGHEFLIQMLMVVTVMLGKQSVQKK